MSRLLQHFWKPMIQRLGSRNMSISAAMTAEAADKSCTDGVGSTNSVSVYIHYPYCESGISHERIERALVSDLTLSLVHPVEALGMPGTLPLHTATSASSRPRIHSVYFGGGTPSLARPEMIHKILETTREYGIMSDDTEVTLEANPTSIEVSKLNLFKQAGINRLSLGVQALDNESLRLLGRDHSARDADAAIAISMGTFSNVSLDFIYGRPGQTVDMWTKELDRISRFGSTHLSLYQLTVERGTKLYQNVNSGKITMPDEDTLADFFEATQHGMNIRNFEQYEVSSFVRDGVAAHQGIHNQSYWTGNDYIGIGPGAHGRSLSATSMQRFRTFRILEPNAWMAQCESIGHGMRRCIAVSQKETLDEIIMLGLRQRQGISASSFDKFGGKQLFHEKLADKQDKLKEMELRKWIVIDRNSAGQIERIQTTQTGLGFGDLMALELLT
ncbi:hypothetical protein BSLG_006196 [Batrachochytrium salamandrivorans]|nr:hypothetical protein BASA62_003450 [Batrachochytrium salamandrivorans]KAH9273689.1 hypothetical protein BASA83_004022 [Batrachochytrium salamandrivorans]KAJ1339057.1 hypothetical protein BSLG_006196 [Batrachochytrium salamandrivorans]